MQREPYCPLLAACLPPVTNRAEPGRKSHSASSQFQPGTHEFPSVPGALGGDGRGKLSPPLGVTEVALMLSLRITGHWGSRRRDTEAYLFMHLDVQSIRHLIVLLGGEACQGPKGCGLVGSLPLPAHSSNAIPPYPHSENFYSFFKTPVTMPQDPSNLPCWELQD